MTTLRVIVVEAEGLMAKDKGGTSDPFVKLAHGRSRFSTSVHKRDLAPTWNEAFEVEVDESDPHLKVVVWDHDRIKNDFLGQLTLEVADLLDGEVHDRWHILQPKSARKPVTGRLRLSVVALGLRGDGNDGGESEELAFSDESDGDGSGADGVAVGPDGVAVVPDRDGDGVPDFDVVVVRVLEARDLGSRKYDPYVEVSHGTELQKTVVVYDNMHPHFREQFVMPLNANDPSIVFQVFDAQVLGSDTLLGRVEVPVADYMDGEVHDEWFALQAPPKKKGLARFAKLPFSNSRPSGELRFQIVLEHRGTALLDYEKSTWMSEPGAADPYMFEGVFILFLIILVCLLHMCGWTQPMFATW